jgi:hypothetical protein
VSVEAVLVGKRTKRKMNIKVARRDPMSILPPVALSRAKALKGHSLILAKSIWKEK